MANTSIKVICFASTRSWFTWIPSTQFPTTKSVVEIQMTIRSTIEDRNVIAHDLFIDPCDGLNLSLTHFCWHDWTSRFQFGENQFNQFTSKSEGKQTNVVSNFHYRTNGHIKSSTSRVDRPMLASTIQITKQDHKFARISKLIVECGRGLSSKWECDRLPKREHLQVYRWLRIAIFQHRFHQLLV